MYEPKGGFRELTYVPPGISDARNFLKWWRKAKGGTTNYWDNLFAQAEAVGAGDLPITRRRLFEEFLTAYQEGNERKKAVILQKHEQAEAALFEAIDPVYQKQLISFGHGRIATIEVMSGSGRFTLPWMKQSLSSGGIYLALDGSEHACTINRNQLVWHGVVDRKTANDFVKVARARNIKQIVEGFGVPSNYQIVIVLIRAWLHITDPVLRRKFARDVHYILERYGGRLLLAQTSAEVLAKGRPQLPGTIFSTQAEDAKMFGMHQATRERKRILHHGDIFCIADYTL